TDVLRREEHVVEERAVERPQGREAGNRLVPKPCESDQAIRNVGELRNVTMRQRQRLNPGKKGSRRVLAMLRCELATHRAPHVMLDVGIRNMRNWRANA